MTYTKGTWKSAGPGRSSTGDFGNTAWDGGVVTGGASNAGGGHGPWPGGGGSMARGGPVTNSPVGNGTCEVGGSVTATLSWSGPLGTEPPAVVVKEETYAAWNGESGTCACGLPSPTVVVDPSGGRAEQGTRYAVKSGHDIVLAALTVKATAKSTDPSTQYAASSASVSYVVTPTPVSIESNYAVRTGATFNFLVGQEADFHVESGPIHRASHILGASQAPILGTWNSPADTTSRLTGRATSPTTVAIATAP